MSHFTLKKKNCLNLLVSNMCIVSLEIEMMTNFTNNILNNWPGRHLKQLPRFGSTSLQTKRFYYLQWEFGKKSCIEFNVLIIQTQRD